MEDCLVSVVMPVYNVEKFLREAIDSILNQTYKNIELIIIDDCSTDNSRDIIKSYSDSRIRAYFNEENLQQPRTRNKALKLANGKYIAVMDSDDISLPNRIEEEVKFMESNKDIDVCGSYIKTFGGSKSRLVRTPLSDEDFKAVSVITSPVAHSTVMLRHSSFEKFNIQYDLDYRYSQDFELWSRLIFEGAKFANIPNVLVHYRENPTGVTHGHSSESQKYNEKVIIRNLKILFGDSYNFDDIFESDHDINSLKKKVNFIIELKNKPNKFNYSSKQVEYIVNYLIKNLVDKYRKIDLNLINVILSQTGINKTNVLWCAKILLKSFLPAENNERK